MLRCINDDNMKHELTVGKLYKINTYNDGEKFVRVFNDLNEVGMYRMERFAKVENENLSIEEYYIGNKGLVIEPNYGTQKDLLENADNDFMFINDESNLKVSCTMNFDEVVKLRDYLTSVIDYTYALGYQVPKELSKEDIEQILGYKVKIVD